MDLQFRDLAAEGDQGLQVAGLADVADHVDRVGALEAHQVRGGEHADDLAFFQHRQVVDVQPGHGDKGVKGQGAAGDGVEVGGHDAADRFLGGETGGDATTAQVPVRDQTRQALTLHDEDGGDAELGHEAGRLTDAGLGGGADDLATGDEVTDVHRKEVATAGYLVGLDQVESLAQPVALGMIKKGGKIRVLVPEAGEFGAGQQVAEGILHGGAGEFEAQLGHLAVHGAEVTLGEFADQVAAGIAQLHRTPA